MTSLTLTALHSTTILGQQQSSAAFIEGVPWRGVLAVEPDPAALKAGTILLTDANYCVTPAASNGELFKLRNTEAVALAILSDRLGHRFLGAVAETVRRQWPRARILILGHTPRLLEDYLYDEQIYRSPDPKQVLSDLEGLYMGMWNQRSNLLDWTAGRPARGFARPPMSESDPTKTNEPALTEEQLLRDRPSEIRQPAIRRN